MMRGTSRGLLDASLTLLPKVSLQYAMMSAGTVHWPIQSHSLVNLVVLLGLQFSSVWYGTHPGFRGGGIMGLVQSNLESQDKDMVRSNGQVRSKP